MKYKFEDATNDKKYFTIVPNYILNHADAVVKALYLDIKRIAGEDGLCFITEETMRKRNKIGEKKLHKALKYLLDHKWIEFIGTTPSKTRPIKTYKVLDIWKENTDFFANKKIPSESGVSQNTSQNKGNTRQKEKDTFQKQSKIPSKRRVEEELNKEELGKKMSTSKKSKKETEKELKSLLEFWNTKYGTKFSSIKGILKNYEYWREDYSVEDIKQAISQIGQHHFWKDKMDPTMFFRQKNPQGEGVDRIAELLNYRGGIVRTIIPRLLDRNI